jgi:hypothetical protein
MMAIRSDDVGNLVLSLSFPMSRRSGAVSIFPSNAEFQSQLHHQLLARHLLFATADAVHLASQQNLLAALEPVGLEALPGKRW